MVEDVDSIELRYRAKEAIRKKMRAVRAAVPLQARREREEHLTERVRLLEPFSEAKTIAGYVSMRAEVDVRTLMSAAAKLGQRIVLPTVDWDSRMLVFREWNSTAELEESGMGFLQPGENQRRVPYEEIDFVLVPALAVDERGYRVGWGGGFYDRALAQMQSAHAVAVIFDFQLLMEVPNTPTDVPVNVVATDKRLISIESEG